MNILSRNEPKTDREHARKWCQTVRAILKIRSRGWIDKKLGRKDSTNESQELHKTWAQINKALEDLEKSDPVLASQWMTIVRDAFEFFLEGGQTRDLARAVSIELREIAARMAVHMAKPGEEGDASAKLADVQMQCAADSASLLSNAFAAAEQQLAELRSYDQEPPHQFSPELAQLIVSARSLSQVAEVGEVLKELAKIGEVVAAAKERAKKCGECRDRLDRAIEGWSDLPDGAIPPEQFRLGSQSVGLAISHFRIADYEQTLNALEPLERLTESVSKSISPEAKEEYKKLRKARKELDRTIEKSNKSRVRLMALRGLDSEKVVATFDKLVERAELDALKLTDATEVDERRRELVGELRKTSKDARKTSKDNRKQSEKDRKQRPEWESRSRLCEDRLAAMLKMPGAGEAAEQLRQELLSARACIHIDARLDPQSGELLSWGYAEALKHLPSEKTLKQTFKEAAAKNAEVLASSLPSELTSSIQSIEEALAELDLWAPPVWAAVQRDEFNEVLGAIRADLAAASDIGKARNEALAKLESLRASFFEDVTNRQSERTRAEMALMNAVASLNKLRENGVPETQFATENRRLNETQAVEFSEREWARAADRFEAIADAADARLAKYVQHAADWNSANETLADATTLASNLLRWPPAASAANLLLEAARNVRQVLADTDDFEAALRAFEKARIVERREELRAMARKVPDSTDANAILGQLGEAGERLRTACHDVRGGVLRKLEKKLKELIDPRATEFHATLATIERGWDDFRERFFTALAKPAEAEAKEFDRKELSNQIMVNLAEQLAQVAIVMNRAQHLLDDDQEFAKFTSDAKLAEMRTLGEQPDAKFAKLFDTLKVVGGTAEEVAAAKKEYGDIMLDSADPAKTKATGALLTNLENRLIERIKSLRGAADVSREVTRKQHKALSKKLDSRSARHKSYKAYHDQLRQQMTDVETLLDVDDPYLATQAQTMLDELRQKVDELSKSKDSGPFSYSETSKELDKIAKQLGGGVGGFVKENLPDEYAKLYEELNDLIVAARSSRPQEAYEMVMSFKPRVEQTVAAAREHKNTGELLKERISELKNRWKALREPMTESLLHQAKEVTGARSVSGAAKALSRPAPALDKFLSARFDEAKSLMKSERGASEATRMLDEVGKLLSRLESNPDPHDAVRQQDAVCEQDQRQVRDMARQFNLEVAVIEKHLLKSVTASLKSREDGDKNLTKGLEQMLDSAKKIVKPYLNLLSRDPRKSDDPAPRMDKMMADFRSAYAALGELRIAANRMFDHSVTTNVTNTGSIKKVQKDWVAQSSHLTKTLRETATAIRDLLGQVKSLPEDEALPADELAQFETDVASAANLVEKLAPRFRADLFHRSFEGLSAEDSDEQKRFREELLRKMREVRVEIIENPLLTKLRSDRNPFGGDKIMAALAYVRSSLKRIELAALLGA